MDSLMYSCFHAVADKTSCVSMGSSTFIVSQFLNQFMARQECSPFGDPSSCGAVVKRREDKSMANLNKVGQYCSHVDIVVRCSIASYLFLHFEDCLQGDFTNAIIKTLAAFLEIKVKWLQSAKNIKNPQLANDLIRESQEISELLVRYKQFKPVNNSITRAAREMRTAITFNWKILVHQKQRNLVLSSMNHLDKHPNVYADLKYFIEDGSLKAKFSMDKAPNILHISS